MGVVSVRLDDQDEAFLRKHKKSISELAREAVHREVLRMQIAERMRFLAEHSITPSQPVEKTIRELRDTRYG